MLRVAVVLAQVAGAVPLWAPYWIQTSMNEATNEI